MRSFPWLTKSLLLCVTLIAMASLLPRAAGAQEAGQPGTPQQQETPQQPQPAPPPADAAPEQGTSPAEVQQPETAPTQPEEAQPQQTPPQPEPPQLVDTEQRLGPFLLNGQAYAVVLHKKRLVDEHQQDLGEALAELRVEDAGRNALYQENFSYEIGDGRFTRSFSAAASVLAGRGGSALAIRFSEQPAATPVNESWVVLGLVNGRLVPFGAPLPLGQDPDAAVGGVLTGVMLRGGIGVEPLASTAEPVEFRVWAGHFYVLVPVRVDWARGKWSEATQCFELFEGTLRPKGCNLRVEASLQPRSSDVTYAQLYAQTEENRYNAQQVTVRPDSNIEFLQTRVIVKWMPSGEHFAGNFDDVWLQVRVDGHQGWVHGEQDFAALGLPLRGSP